MFTLDQISAAHQKVKSGADFPNYFKDLMDFGIVKYDTFVADGHTVFVGNDGHSVTSKSKYEILPVAKTSNKDAFQNDLKNHQQGQTDFPTFCRDAAKNGVEKWAVDMAEKTCTYFDKAGNIMLTEKIPG